MIGFFDTGWKGFWVQTSMQAWKRHIWFPWKVIWTKCKVNRKITWSKIREWRISPYSESLMCRWLLAFVTGHLVDPCTSEIGFPQVRRGWAPLYPSWYLNKVQVVEWFFYLTPCWNVLCYKPKCLHWIGNQLEVPLAKEEGCSRLLASKHFDWRCSIPC